jgi:hypothetical protein
MGQNLNIRGSSSMTSSKSKYRGTVIALSKQCVRLIYESTHGRVRLFGDPGTKISISNELRLLYPATVASRRNSEK